MQYVDGEDIDDDIDYGNEDDDEPDNLLIFNYQSAIHHIMFQTPSHFTFITSLCQN